MKKTVLLGILLLFELQITSSAQWETQNSGVTSNLSSICFIDSSNGWAVGDSSTILKTTDGGKNWLKQISPVQLASFKKVEFLSKSTGFILGDTSLFLSTEDGGSNWKINYIKSDVRGVTYTDFCFININEGWVCGRKEGSNFGIGLILHTSDGGKTWEKQLETYTTVQTEAKFFSAIRFENNMVGWALASSYFDNFSATYVYKTINGGIGCQIISEIDNYPYSKLNIAGDDTLWLGGGIFIKSFDGGLNWQRTQNNYDIVDAMSTVNGLAGWVFDSKPFTDTSEILYTSNAGTTWIKELTLTHSFIYSMDNFKDNLWITGTNGLIMHKGSKPSFINLKKTREPIKFKLYQNYPNPFNPVTIIRFEILQPSNISLIIYNVLGKEINRLINNQYYKAATYQIQWNGKDKNGNKAASGIYFYRLITNRQTFTKSMIILK